MRLAYPLAVDLEVINACNLACQHCMVDSHKQPAPNLLGLNEIQSLMDELADNGVASISITGGEPFLRSDLREIVKYAANRNFAIQISTNGILLDDDILPVLTDERVLVNVSIDGATAETHDLIRGRKGTFDKVCANIKRMVASGVNVRTETTLMMYNVNQIEGIIQLVAGLGVKRHSINDLRMLGRALLFPLLRVPDSIFFDLVKDLPQLARRFGVIVGMPRWTGAHQGAYSGDCAAAVYKCGVSAEGLVKPCLLFPNESVPAFKRIRQAWDSDFFESVARSVQDRGSGCADLPCQRFCGGGCRAAALLAGRLTGPDPSCRRENPPKALSLSRA